MDEVTVFVCTYNSASLLTQCLSSVRRALPSSRLVIIDHHSADGTVNIAKKFGAEVYYEDVGLGRARQMALEMATSRYLAFVDSDVELVRNDFFDRAASALKDPKVGAVVGMAVGHRLAYGLPAGLLVLRTEDFRGQVIPDFIDARETFYLVSRLEGLELGTVYLADCMVHRSEFRQFKPEWEGANTRLASGVSPSELAFALKVIVLLSLNSKNPKNIAYIPVFYLKFLRGFVQPARWRRMPRKPGGAAS